MTILPGYTIAEPVHLGHDTILYRSERDEDHARVIVKLPSGPHPAPRVLARLRHEYGILRDLDVPGVVKAHGLVPCDRGVALILEEIPGRSLSSILEAGPLGLELAFSVAVSLASTLVALHERRILHKDIKPHNVLVSPSGTVRLVDFGIASRMSPEAPPSLAPDALEGTLAYMSPEQTGRMNRVVDHRSDLYSLGITLYEMLTGAPPFTTRDATEMVHAHIARTPTSVSSIRPEVPGVVSDIVAKLLAKAAEDRYQTARGLCEDLQACLSQWRAARAIERFPLGRRDFSSELRVPQKLYGRATELAALFTAFDRVKEGSAELLLVAGSSGVGKSSLVEEIRKPIAGRGGHFVAGKFDLLHGSIPYAPIVHAFRDLVGQILTESAESLAARKQALREALGDNGGLLVALVPELELVIGPQPRVNELSGPEAQNRFAVLVQRFLRVFCGPEHPLVLFLDDLQWADPGSLKLLQVILTAPDRGYLLVLGAYRDNEVGPGHPLAAALAAMREGDAAFRTVALAPLAEPHVAELLSETLRCPAAEVEPLARIVHEKTLGNPFFLNQLLQLLHKEKLVLFDASSGAFQWDLEPIRRAPATSNVVDLMVAQLMRLSGETRHVLSLAACIGHRFDLHTLSLIHERSMVQTAHALWEALAEGFILPLDGDYRFAHDPGLKDGDELPANLSVSYRFLHDRVQQVAYQLTDEVQRPALHLRIGRLLLGSAEGLSGAENGALAERLFDVADHLNRGASLIDDPEPRLALARLDLAAGKKAKAATAYESAANYLAAGVAALPETALGEHHDLAFELRLEHAQCEYLGGHLERAEALFDDLFPFARSRLERTRIQTLRIMFYVTQARVADAIATARAALSEFGLILPDTPEAQALMCEAELAAIEEKRAGRRPDQLIDLPVSRDPEHCAVLRLFMVTAPSAYLVSPGLLSLINTVPVRLSLEHGNTEYSAFGYVAFANLLCAKLGRYREGYAYGQLAIALNERFRNTELAGKTYETFAGHVQHFRAPLRDSLELLDTAYRASLSAGDFNYLSYVTIMLAINRFGLGDELGALADLAVRHGALTAQIKDAPGMAFHRATRELIARFVAPGGQGGPGRADEPFDEAQFLTTMEKVGLSLVACWFNAGMAKHLLLQERYAESLAATAEAERLLSSAAGCHFTTTVPFYACLTMLALYPDVSGDDRARFDAEIARHRAHLAHLADNCPHNYRHCLRLVDAEIARVKGELDAVRLYDLAIADARTSGFLHHEALANELAAKLYRALGNLEIAATYMTDAHACYRRWGALAKVAQIEQRYADLLVVHMPAALSFTGTATSRQRLSARSFDVAAVMRAAQAIAGEIVLPRVVERLLRIAVAHAGAQRGALLLVKGDHLLLEASLSVDPETIEVGLGAPLEQRPELPRTILGFVMRTREPLVLADVSVDPRFAADAAFSSRCPRAVLCSPLVHQGRLTGLLYLEHAAAAGVFDHTRAELLSLLSAQAAIALQNASLLSDLGAATDEVRRTNEGLEAEVQRRTDELLRSNDELAVAKRMLEVELEERARAEEERVRAEEERARLQAQVIAAQEARLVELSTPFIPITDDVVVMPLIGAIDPKRAEQIMDVALHGAQSRGAKVVILDITGVKHADGTADTLVRTAHALRLLGAETILTGVRPEIARALLETGAELSAVTTRSTLQGAIAHALARSSGRRGRS